jgi:glycosyltransferase involved in cell wall biosynthesis
MGNLLHVDGWVCINQCQAQLLRDALPGTEKRVTVVSQGVDTAFFDPTRASAPQLPPYILSVGAEMRNYTLLLDAVCELDVPVILKTSSTWMQNARETLHVLPPNVEVVDRRISYAELRDLYQGALLSVVPLYDTPQAAGITSILEAMSLAKPVVLTRSMGLPDGLIDGRNCVVVEPDSAELASALGRLLNEPGTMANIGRCGQTFVRENYSLERHASGIARFLKCCAQSKAPQPIFRSN